MSDTNDLILSMPHHVGKAVESVHVWGDLAHYERRKGDDEGLDRIVVTFTDGTRIVASYWTSEMGGLTIDEGE
jgi:hypothetical protein